MLNLETLVEIIAFLEDRAYRTGPQNIASLPVAYNLIKREIREFIHKEMTMKQAMGDKYEPFSKRILKVM